MKSEKEIHRVHDILEITLKDLDIVANDSWIACAIASLQVLCWVLDHEQGKTFEENMLNLEAECFGQGIVFKEIEE